MPKKNELVYYAADGENTVPPPAVYEDGSIAETPEYIEARKSTFFWSLAACPVKPDPTFLDVTSFDTVGTNDPDAALSRFFEWAEKQPGTLCFKFHNLAYDGRMIQNYIMRRGYTEQPEPAADELDTASYWKASQKVERGHFSSCVTGEGVWYSIKVRMKHSGKLIVFHDSHKILPFSLDVLAKEMKTKAQKLVGEIDYSKHREPGYQPEPNEQMYQINDVLVLSEALDKVKEYGLLECLTIGSHCMKDFKQTIGGGDIKKGKKLFKARFPIPSFELDRKLRPAYKGAICYAKHPRKRFKGVKGSVYDVNSMYPFVMVDHRYPIGEPKKVDPKDFEKYKGRLFIISGLFDLHVKDNHMPCLQLKQTRGNHDNIYYIKTDGLERITMTSVEYELLMEQYDMNQAPLIDEMYIFDECSNIFDEYIEKWYKVKKFAKNKVERLIAKLMLNNLYGKFASNPLRTKAKFRIEEGKLMSESITEITDGGYIPVGSFITAYARSYLVRSAQANWDNFLYCDTDSLHILGEAKGLKVGPELGDWDHEASFDDARYVRQKTYIEHLVEYKGEPCDRIDVKACGAPDAVKTRLKYDVTDFEYVEEDVHRVDPYTGERYTVRERVESGHVFHRLTRNDMDEITSRRRSNDEIIERFDLGLKECGKLMRSNVRGGVILVESYFSIKP